MPYDVVVVGGGLAGLSAANRAAELGLSALVLEQGDAVDYPCNSRFAGGIVHVAQKDMRADPADIKAAIDALLAFGTLGAGFDRDAFAADVGRVFRERAAGAMAQARGEAGQASADPSRLEALVDEILRVARRHGVDLPSETIVLVKTLVTIEGVARALDPELDVVVTALPILLRSLAPSWLSWRPWPSAR